MKRLDGRSYGLALDFKRARLSDLINFKDGSLEKSDSRERHPPLKRNIAAACIVAGGRGHPCASNAMLHAGAFMRGLAVIALLVLMGLVLAGCQSLGAPESASPAEPKTFASGITGYNFTNEGVQHYSVDRQYGSNLPPYGGGGSTSCCVSLPTEWRAGLTVKVHWTIGHYTLPWEKRQHMTVAEETACCWTQRTLSKTVPIERYEEGGRLQVFFLPNDEIKVYVSDMGLGHEDHPSGMAYPKKPAGAP